MSQREIKRIVLKVEEKLGWEFTPEEINDVLKYTIRKADLNRKGNEYIPILFENELRDYVMRETINYMGRINQCVKFAI